MWDFLFLNYLWEIHTTFCKLFKWKKTWFCFVKMEHIFTDGNRSSTKHKHTEESRLTVLREKEFYMRTLTDGWTILNVSDFLKFIFFEEKKDFFKQLREEKQVIFSVIFSNKLYFAFCVNVDNSGGATGICFENIHIHLINFKAILCYIMAVGVIHLELFLKYLSLFLFHGY